MRLIDKVMERDLYQQRKHDLGAGYAERQINKMSNMELLKAISDALEELKSVPDPVPECARTGPRDFKSLPSAVW